MIISHTVALTARTTGRHWNCLGPTIPSGLFLSVGDEIIRHWVFRHRGSGQSVPVAVQLEDSKTRPAFSFSDLSKATDIQGVWMGSPLLALGRVANTNLPHRCGLLRILGDFVVVRCCGPQGEIVDLRVAESAGAFAIDEVPFPITSQRALDGQRFKDFALKLVEHDATELDFFRAPRRWLFRAPYEPLTASENAWSNAGRVCEHTDDNEVEGEWV